ncbi:MAG TPA: SOS response-associated peptidase [Flavobacteriales bacterium]|nr:SOS response-associated peptidase [Flavobacteriales bacterium]|tara:strand:+ start:118923 stop:119543 length:621 start_codon:yes stop_codon:yes gene_type:complete
MCFHTGLHRSKKEIEETFQAKFEPGIDFEPQDYIGFSFPQTPVILHMQPTVITLCQWGLIPNWAKDMEIRKFTLNAKIETITEKPSFKNSVNNRCLVIVDGFYEWKWLDEKGKQKQKYLITLKDEPLFALAGIWSEWTDKSTGEVIKSYAIVTTQANDLMAEIHNKKKRMPVVLNHNSQKEWLDLKPIHEFAYPLYDVSLQATPVV